MKSAGCRSWFDTPVLSYVEGLTTNGPFALSLSKGDGPRHVVTGSKKSLRAVIPAEAGIPSQSV